MKNWKKDASSYANQLKTEKKVHWPLNISAFVSFFSFFLERSWLMATSIRPKNRAPLLLPTVNPTPRPRRKLSRAL